MGASPAEYGFVFGIANLSLFIFRKILKTKSLFDNNFFPIFFDHSKVQARDIRIVVENVFEAKDLESSPTFLQEQESSNCCRVLGYLTITSFGQN